MWKWGGNFPKEVMGILRSEWLLIVVCCKRSRLYLVPLLLCWICLNCSKCPWWVLKYLIAGQLFTSYLKIMWLFTFHFTSIFVILLHSFLILFFVKYLFISFYSNVFFFYAFVHVFNTVFSLYLQTTVIIDVNCAMLSMYFLSLVQKHTHTLSLSLSFWLSLSLFHPVSNSQTYTSNEM